MSLWSSLKKLKRFICRLVRWLPVLWNQEDWDYEYIYDLLQVKMQELRHNLELDTWHEGKEIKRCIRQIDVCLARLDRWRNWPDYYDYPMKDVLHVPTSQGFYKIEHFSQENEKQRLGAIKFEEKKL